MPSVYVGGPMLEPAAAESTIAEAVRIGTLCQPFGCKAVVHNADPKSGGTEKSDAELARQAENLNNMGRALLAGGLQLRVHNHTPEMISGAREWRYALQHTDPNLVWFCLDLDWVYQGGQEPLALLKEAGKRVAEVHVRNSRDKLWLESFAGGDVDYRAVGGYFKASGLLPLIVVELAYRPNTVITQPLGEDLRRSREYAEQIFR